MAQPTPLPKLLPSANWSVPFRHVRKTGKGQARATYLGVQATKASWIALFDDDRLADEDCVSKMLQRDRTAGASCVGSLALNAICATRRGMLGEHVFDASDGRYSPKLFPHCGGALIGRHVFGQVGHFEEGLELGGYDIVFSGLRESAGFRDSYAYEAAVYHLTPRYRVGFEYFKWASLRMSANIARRDRRFATLTQIVLKSIARNGLIVKMATLIARGCAAPANLFGLLP